MDVNAIVVFVRVVEAGSFVGAARLAQIPKSTVARRIDELEESLGVRLLQRSTRQSTLTDAGRAFYERCRQIVDDIDEATTSVSELQHEPRGRLRFTTSVLLAETYIGAWVVEYLKKYPKVELDMYATARKADLLADGFDLAIRVGRLEPSAHIVRKLAPTPQYICASPAYLEAHGAPETTEDLQNHECVIFCPDRAKRRWELENEGGDSAAIAISGRCMVNSFPVALDAVRTVSQRWDSAFHS